MPVVWKQPVMQDIVRRFSKCNLKLNHVQSMWVVVWKQPIMQDIVKRFSKRSVKCETELCTEHMGSGVETASHAGHC